MPSIAAGGGAEPIPKYRRYHRPIVHLPSFCSHHSRRPNAIEIVTTGNGRKNGFLCRDWVDNVFGPRLGSYFDRCRHRLSLGVFRTGQDKGSL